MRLNKISEGQKVAICFTVIIFILININPIYGLLVKPQNEIPIDIPLCKVSNQVNIDVATQEKNKYLNVPDYYANIFINSSKQKYIVDDIADINVEIQDKGILKLSKPYFYVLLFEPSNKLKEIFPCFINEKEKEFISSRPKSFYSHKWEKWTSPLVYIGNGKYKSCNDDYFYLFQNLPNGCISRDDLINGSIGNIPIRYTFKINEPGTWKIYVFLFDEEYYPRPNVRLLSDYSGGSSKPQSFENAVAYGYYELLVRSESGVNESDNENNISKFIPFLINILIAAISYYSISREKIYPILKKTYTNHITKLKNELLGLLVFLIIILVYTYFVLKFLV